MNSITSGGSEYDPSGNLLRATVLSENCNMSPNNEEITHYAKSLGVDLTREPELFDIVRQGISEPVPEGWQVMQDENNEMFYYHPASGKSLWEHPQDAWYRSRVNQSRLAREKRRANKNGSHFINQSSGESSCSTSTRVLRPLPIFKIQHTSTPVEVLERATKSVSFNKTSRLASTSALSEQTSNVVCSNNDKLNTMEKTMGSTSENEAPTEYLNLVLSNSTDLYPKSLSGFPSMNFTKSRSVLTQTTNSPPNEDNNIRSTHSTTVKYDGGFCEGNQQVSTLQAKLQLSFASDNKTLPVADLCSCSTQMVAMLDSPRDSPPLMQSNVHYVGSRKNEKGSPELAAENIRDNHVSNTAKMDALDLPSSFCPELGTSPTEDKRMRKCDASVLSAVPEQSITSGMHGSGDGPQTSTFTNNEAHHDPVSSAPRFCLRQSFIRPDEVEEPVSSAAPMIASIDHSTNEACFNEGMGHLIEERSRLQRKMLRIKLIYKTFKQRLASLDSSLRVLQQQHPHVTSLPVADLHKHTTGLDDSTKPVCHFPVSHSASKLLQVSPLCSSPGPTHPQTATPEIITIREGKRSQALFSDGKPHRSLSIPRHSSLRDSVFIPSKPSCSFHPSASCMHTNSTLHDLACSLASIDSHLQRVLCQSDSTDSAVCDICVMGKHKCGRSVSPRRVDSTPVERRTLEDELALLSIRHPRLNRLSVISKSTPMGDVRLLTPLSPEERSYVFQRPSVDVSPT